jgi:DDE_Tnp_1-associated/Putative restriction endonuclease
MPELRADWPRTLEEFRVWHERQPEVYEFIDGVPRLMAPGSEAHTRIKSNVGRALGNALESTGCQAYVDGVQVEGENFSFIPDVVVTCGPEDYATPRVDEPVIVVEVLSPSSEKDDIGRKQAFYLGVPSLRHYPGSFNSRPDGVACRPDRRADRGEGMGRALWEVLEGVPDRRAASGRRYSLPAILAITVAALLAGRTSLAAIARWGRQLDREALRALGIMRPRAPCHSTYHDVFRDLDVAALEAGLAAWVRSAGAAAELGHVALDGKRLRGSRTAEGVRGCTRWPPSAAASKG